MELRLDKASAVPVYLQIRDAIREQILSGRLAGGEKLLPERKLASALRINRSTVLAAYRELKDEGLVEARVGSGTVVKAPPPRPGGPGPFPAAPLPWRSLFGSSAAREHDPLLRDLLELTERRDVLSLAAGLPAPELLPIDTFSRIAVEVLAEHGAEALLHSPTEGLTPFRESLAALTASRGIPCTAAEVLVTSGSQQGLDLAARVFLDPGDAVVVEEPTYFGALEAFRTAQVRLLGVPVDGDGMRTDLLEALLERHRPKLIYTLPTFQNPSGAVMSLARRRHLLELAARHGVPVLEDDSYSDLRYDGEPLPALAALDAADAGGTGDSGARVLYLSSLSKVLVPGFRLGWLRAPEPVVRQLALAKQAIDLHSGTLGQLLVDRFLRDGLFAPHAALLRREYARRRAAILGALSELAPGRLSFVRPAGGYYVWARAGVGVLEGRLLAEAAREGVAFLPGAACHVHPPAETFLRLNFTHQTPERIREGVGRLARALAAAEAEGPPKRRDGAGTPPIV